MMYLIVQGRSRCWFWHDWMMFHKTAITEYSCCLKCGARRVRQRGDGYQPIDWYWLDMDKEGRFKNIVVKE